MQTLLSETPVELSRFGESAPTSDPMLTSLILRALRLNRFIPAGHIQVTVLEGWVILTGTVTSNLQRQLAEAAVGNVQGVIGVANHLIATNQAEQVG